MSLELTIYIPNRGKFSRIATFVAAQLRSFCRVLIIEDHVRNLDSFAELQCAIAFYAVKSLKSRGNFCDFRRSTKTTLSKISRYR